MDIKIEKFSFHLLFILILGTLGDVLWIKNTEQPIVEKANETTIKYFKEKENLDVVITGYEFAPSDFQTVFIKGHVKDDKTQAFTLHVEYGDSDYRVTSRTYSESLE